MSRHNLLNLTTGGVAALLVGAVIFAATAGGGGDEGVRLALAADQQEFLEEIALDAAELASAQDLQDVAAAREALGRSIYRFDHNLAALLDGGTATDRAGRSVALPAAAGAARGPLEAAADLWLQVGLPLSDLAAGSFSSYSAAGRRAVSGYEEARGELDGQLATAAAALQTAAARRVRLAASARTLAAVLGVALLGLLGARRLGRRRAAAPAADTDASAPASVPAAAAPAPPRASAAAPRPLTPQPYAAPVDLENLSASVDQLTVDLQAIAGNSDRMQQAIDSVGHALQGMLFSLNEMAADTADGERVVRGARTAAGYTAEVAAALVDNVREMSRVVGNVTELARRTRETAGRVDLEAARGDRTGKGFSMVVANEVRGLAARTAETSATVETTVSELLAQIRSYEEAIGQIIKHVTAINRVSRDLGDVMLDPPGPAVVPAPVPAPAVTAEVAEPAPEPAAERPAAETAAPAAAEIPQVEPATPEDFAAETAAAIDEATAALADVGAPDAEPAPEPAPEPEPAAAPATFSLDPPRDQEPAPAPAADPAPAAAAPARSPSSFVLEPPPGITPQQRAPQDVPAAAEPSSAVFVLSRAQEDDAPAASADAPDPGDEPAVAEGAESNIFVLNPPAGADDDAEAPAAPEAETVPPRD